MGCGDIRDLLPLYAGGEVSEDDRRAVEEHVRLCGACARDLDQYREARAQLALLGEGDVPPGLWRSLWSGIRAELLGAPASGAAGVSWVEMGLRCAAALFLGVAIGLGAHIVGGLEKTASSRDLALPVPPLSEPVNASARGAGPARVLSANPSPRLRVEPPRLGAFLPEADLGQDAYLPKVESLLSGDGREF